ncbi:unnamed protein product [Rotaria sp. Silwood1]|nr:unnamed protein product [Rotaria sp. Silwood1]CAF4595450.1 unnamed protein product [Rotaria sp. Silwood1]
MDPTSVLSTIYEIAMLIKQSVKQVKANEKQCKRLADRVDAITSILQSRNDNDLQRLELRKSLTNFCSCIKQCLEFITKFSDETSWFFKVFKNQNFKRQFEELNCKLSESATDLNLGINLKQIFDSDNDANDQQIDINTIQSKLDEIAFMMVRRQEAQLGLDKNIEQYINQRLRSFKYQLEQNIIKTNDPVKAQEIAQEENAFLHIPYYDLLLKKCIGQGGFADVYRGKWLSQDHEVAIKVIRIQQLGDKLKEDFVKEISIMYRIRYDHILNIFGACMEPGNYALIVEYMSLGSLYDVLRQETMQLTWTDRWSIALQMTKGINHLHTHTKPIIHRDIKSLNVFMTGRSQDILVKIGDFGLAKIRHETSCQSSKNTSVGTLPWKAPELLKMGKHTEASDVYALGIVLWELATGCEPYEESDESTISAFVQRGDRLDIPPTTPMLCHKLLQADVVKVVETTSVTEQRSSIPRHRWIENGITIAGGNISDKVLKQLDNPHGLCVDENQAVYIADYGNHRIVEWKLDAKSGQVIAGGNGQGYRTDQLNRPTDVIVDNETNSLIICDRWNRRVMLWSRRKGTTNGETIMENISCWGLAMDDQRYLYVSDWKNNEVRRFRMGETKGIVVAGGNGQGDRLNQLHFPTYICVDRDQSVYVSDLHNNRVMKWEKGAIEGIVVIDARGEGHDLTQLNGPQGVFVDLTGTLYVVDRRNHRVVRCCKEVTQRDSIVGSNEGGEKANQLYMPKGLSFDRLGNLYVSDCGNNRVQRYSIQDIK